MVAEAVGLYSFNIGEHYRTEFMDSAAHVVLAAIASRTERIRLGTAVTVLSTEDLVRVYTDFATLDAVSNGRAQLVVGRGSLTDSFPLFGFDLADYEDPSRRSSTCSSACCAQPVKVGWASRPCHRLCAQQADEQVELLLEEVLVVGEVEPEQREGVRQGAPPDDQLRAAVRDGVERREVGVHAHRVLGAQHRHGRAQPDPLGAAGDRRQHDVCGRVHELGPVVLADVEGVEPDRLGHHRLLQRVADDLVARERLPGLLDGHRQERIHTELELRHPEPSPQ